MHRSCLFVSVLIANYNNGCFLQTAIDSVYSQDYSFWEIIIVDDKSTDESFSVYEKYSKDERIRVFYNESNRGVGFTKRRCVDNARGDICCFLDPDDVLVGNDVLSIMAKEHNDHPEVSMVYSSPSSFSERGSEYSFPSIVNLFISEKSPFVSKCPKCPSSMIV